MRVQATRAPKLSSTRSKHRSSVARLGRTSGAKGSSAARGMRQLAAALVKLTTKSAQPSPAGRGMRQLAAALKSL